MSYTKLFALGLINLLVINATYCKIGSIGMQQKRNSVIGSLKPLTKESFDELIRKAQEEKATSLKHQLADIITTSPESTVKGIPTYTSKKEKEAYEQIENSQTLISSCIKWANDTELLEIFTNIFEEISFLFIKLKKAYPDEKTLFITFASDLKEEATNLEKQIERLTQLKNVTEVKENSKINIELEQTLDKLINLKNNAYSLIEKVNNLIIAAIKIFESENQQYIIPPIFKEVPDKTINFYDDIRDFSEETDTDYIITRSFPDLPQIIMPVIPVEISDDYFFFHPSYA